ncbi:MAG: hypothetical protein MUO40_13475, partial [Anaerolineaceae bacterium]|nr:hypothetical protein [Anaerolineaceae bacterium]
QDINESISIDVTGGMRSKVKIMMALSKKVPGLQSRIFSAIDPKNIELAIKGDEIGTLISDSE